jgi:hypothetical protein
MLDRLPGANGQASVVALQMGKCFFGNFSCSSNNCCVCVRNVVFLADILLESETSQAIPAVAG